MLWKYCLTKMDGHSVMGNYSINGATFIKGNFSRNHHSNECGMDCQSIYAEKYG
jgi:hypothetical protein